MATREEVLANKATIPSLTGLLPAAAQRRLDEALTNPGSLRQIDLSLNATPEKARRGGAGRALGAWGSWRGSCGFVSTSVVASSGKVERLDAPPDGSLLLFELAEDFHHQDCSWSMPRIHAYFKRHWLHVFPKIGCRTTFAGQAAKRGGPHGPHRGLRRPRGEHFRRRRLSAVGTRLFEGAFLTAFQGLGGHVLADKGFNGPKAREALAGLGLGLQTPSKKNMAEERPKEYLRAMMSARRLVETVIGQLAERMSIEKCRPGTGGI